ncbi:MAG: hypothetical protein DMG06_05485 [Acidobacteria bacterium]|nr:MAG: hypothetical protein DMG06_05485 [Acidobacteriota bacterium]
MGPAGAGKTALLRTLIERNAKIRPVFRLKEVSCLPSFLGQVILFLPTFFRQCPRIRRFTWREIKMIVHLKALQHDLRRQAAAHGTVTVLDQGPVFMLARLMWSGAESIKNKSFGKWWDSIVSHWASTLDMAIWLDAPDAILLERIRTRNKWHLIKGESEEVAHGFLSCFRSCYEQVILQLSDHGGPTVLRFDTDQESLNQIVDRVQALIDLKLNES